MCCLAQIRIILLVSMQEPLFGKKVGRTTELALHLFIRDNYYAVLTATEKMEFLGKLCIPKIVGCEKARSPYLFQFMGGFVLCASPFSRKRSFLLVFTEQADI